MKIRNLIISTLVIGTPTQALAVDINDYDRTGNDGELNVYLRAVHIDTRVENDLLEDMLGELPTGNRLGGTALGIVTDYESLYWKDTIGFDVSFYGVAKLDGQPEDRDLFDDTSGENKGFAQLGEANLKFRHGGEKWVAAFQAGRGRFDAGTVITKDTRAVPGSYQGVRGQTRIEGLDIGPLPGVLTLDAAYIDRTSPRDRGDFEAIVSEGGHRINDIRTFGAKYDAKLFALQFARGVANDFNRNTNYGLTLRAPIGESGGAVLDTQYYDFQKAGAVWDRDLSTGDAAYAEDASWLNVNLGLEIKRWGLGLSYSKSEAELGNGMLGHAYFDHGENADGLLEAWTRSGNDFNNDGEEAWQVGAQYDFDGYSLGGISLDGFNIRAIYKRGEFDATNPLTGVDTEVEERQTEYRLNYRFDEPELEGVSVGLIYTRYRIDEEFVALISAQPEQALNGDEVRVYIDYAF